MAAHRKTDVFRDSDIPDEKTYALTYLLPSDIRLHAFKLHSRNYRDALNIAKCVCGDQAVRCLIVVHKNSALFDEDE
jgi:hypothetical protein